MAGRDQVALFTRQTLPASQVPTDPIRCPKCGSKKLIIKGHLSFPHTEVRDGDEVVSRETNYDVEAPFELSEFACLACQIEYDIQPDREVQLSLELSKANAELRRLQGKASNVC